MVYYYFGCCLSATPGASPHTPLPTSLPPTGPCPWPVQALANQYALHPGRKLDAGTLLKLAHAVRLARTSCYALMHVVPRMDWLLRPGGQEQAVRDVVSSLPQGARQPAGVPAAWRRSAPGRAEAPPHSSTVVWEVPVGDLDAPAGAVWLRGGGGEVLLVSERHAVAFGVAWAAGLRVEGAGGGGPSSPAVALSLCLVPRFTLLPQPRAAARFRVGMRLVLERAPGGAQPGLERGWALGEGEPVAPGGGAGCGPRSPPLLVLGTGRADDPALRPFLFENGAGELVLRVSGRVTGME
jgi:hypothetical protein